MIEEIQGDLHEAYYHRLKTIGQRKANQLFVADVFRFFNSYAFEKYSMAKQFLTMFNNYFKIAFRNILHRKGFTAINLFGLAIDIAAVLLIGLYLRYEYTYDQSVPDHDKIYRLMNNYRGQNYSPMQFLAGERDTQLRLINYLSAFDDIEVVGHFVPSQSAIGGGELRIH